MSAEGGGPASRERRGGGGAVSLVEAVSRIQRCRAMERTGREMPPDFLAAGGALSFFSAGFRAGLREVLLLAALLPPAFGVRAGAVPVFGGEAGFFEKCLAFLLCFGASLAATAAAGAVLAGCRPGGFARKAADSLLWGRAAGLLAGAAGVFLLFHALFLLAGPENVGRFARQAGAVLPFDPAAVRSAVNGMREPVRAGAFLLLLCAPLLGFLPFLSLPFAGRRRRRRR